jgi:DNA-binding transcriptional MerR regulator
VTAGGSVSTPKPHLSIGEVLALLQPDFPDVTISKIRFLESQGLIDPERTPSGYRKFYDDDLERLRWILTQQRDHFLPLKVIKDRIDDGDSPDDGDGDGVGAAGLVGADPEHAEPGDGLASAAPKASATAGDRAALADALARRAAQRAVGNAAGRPVVQATLFDDDPTSVSMSTAELAAAAGIAEREVERLESFGLVEGRSIGREKVYEGDALAIATLAAAFLERGLEPRHLRMFKVAAEREASVYEQLVLSLTRLRDPASRREAQERLSELADLGNQLRLALLRQAVRSLTNDR